jgi:hypothetical protein
LRKTTAEWIKGRKFAPNPRPESLLKNGQIECSPS